VFLKQKQVISIISEFLIFQYAPEDIIRIRLFSWGMKMYKKSMINLLVSLAVGLGIAFSSAVWAKNPVAAVKNQDTNGDNKVSLGE
jgi:hypothetical protein